MNHESNETVDDTIRLMRPPPRVFTEIHGRTVWMGDVQALELELEPETPETDPYNNSTSKRR